MNEEIQSIKDRLKELEIKVGSIIPCSFEPKPKKLAQILREEVGKRDIQITCSSIDGANLEFILASKVIDEFKKIIEDEFDENGYWYKDAMIERLEEMRR